ncbi:MAG TPA: Tad domain-containing protein [Methanosarcinales archaeon]|nr:Tad domain-containing protein [Methanosarcinales archaeon]
MLLSKIKNKNKGSNKESNKGNISMLALLLTIFFAFLFMACIDLCRIYIARELTKDAADAASLSIAQNLLFFENFDYINAAEEISSKNRCELVKCYLEYDEVVVIMEKKLNFILIDKFFPESCTVKSTSKTKIIYPWDDYFGFCKNYDFNFD